MADVFISYATEDRERVEPIVEAIERAGFSVWWDRRIGLGSSFDREIERELDSARCVLVVWSANSIESDWVRNEAQEGLDRSVLVPLLIDDVRPPLAFRRAQTALIREKPTRDELNLIVTSVQFTCERDQAGRAFDQSNEHGRTPGVTRSQERRWRWSWIAGGASAVLVLVLAGIWSMQEAQQFTSKQPGQEAEPAQQTKVAVLPFTNMSNDQHQEYFSDGITEDILNELARNTSLIVRPRSSAFALKGASLDLQAIGRQLNVTHILNGSVRRSGERIRVTVQLSEVSGNRSIWSDRYERELSDVFIVQDEITREVVEALNAQFVRHATPREFVGDEAYDAFLLGRHHMSRFEVQEAIGWMKIATNLNPDNADAWADLARVNAIMTFLGLIPNFGQPLQDRSEHIARALAIDPSNPNAQGLKAMFMFIVDRDYQASIDQLVELVKSNPNNREVHLYLSYVLGAIERHVLAEKVALRIVELDPLSSGMLGGHVGALLNAGAVEDARRWLDAYNANSLVPRQGLAMYAVEVALAEGDVAAMKAALAYPSMRFNPNYRVWSALVPYLQGNVPAVQEMLAPLNASTEYVSHVVQSRAALLQGRFDAALDHWREGAQTGEPIAVLNMTGLYSWRKTFPEFYVQPSYQQMLVDFGLDTASISNIIVPDLPF